MIERPRPQSKVSLEDLLRLKRAERPAPEFWAEFEDQLRHKQLAAIVDKRSWWRRLSALSFVRISIPVGATAAIAFTIGAVRERSLPAGASAVTAQSSVSPSTAPAIQPLNADAHGSVVASADLKETSLSPIPSSATVPVAVTAMNRSSTESSGTLVALQDAPQTSLAQAILGLEGMAESDQRPQYQDTESSALLTSLDIPASGRTQAVVASLDSNSLSQVSAPRDDRRARLLASVDSSDRGDLVAGNSRVARSRERIANRLAEQSLYDSISRLGVNGDSVSIKF